MPENAGVPSISSGIKLTSSAAQFVPPGLDPKVQVVLLVTIELWSPFLESRRLFLMRQNSTAFWAITAPLICNRLLQLVITAAASKPLSCGALKSFVHV